jgi:hypothetical protein
VAWLIGNNDGFQQLPADQEELLRRMSFDWSRQCLPGLEGMHSLGISQHVLGIALESGIFVSSNCSFYLLLITLRFPSDFYS